MRQSLKVKNDHARAMKAQTPPNVVWPSSKKVTQRPTATMAATARIRQPQGDITTIPSAGRSVGLPAGPGSEVAGSVEPLSANREPTPLSTSAGGLSVPRFFDSYLPRAIRCRSLDRSRPGLTGTDAHDAVDGADPDLAVAYLAGASRFGYHLDDVVGLFGRG